MTHGYLIGTFDVLTVRDLDLIAMARSRCDELVVGLLTDEQVQSQTGRRPVTSFVDRAALLARLRGIAAVVVHQAEEAAGRLVLIGADDAVHSGHPLAQVIIPARDTASTVMRAARGDVARTAVA